MEKFETPIIETIAFESKDVIATSTEPDLDDGKFDNEVVKP